MAIPTFTEKGYLAILPENARDILEFIDGKISYLLGPLSQSEDFFFYLAGGGAVLIDTKRWSSYRQSKDLDFLWVPDNFHIESIIERIRKNPEKIIPHEEIFGDEDFISMDVHSDMLTGDIKNKFLMEFLNLNMLIEEGSEYDIYDFREDLEQYFLNEDYKYLSNIRVCNAYVTWYNRLVTLRDSFNNSFVGSTIFENPYFEKTLIDIQNAINLGHITKEDVRENIGYLINKYFANSPQVHEDFETFLGELKE